MGKRISKHEYYLNIARAVSARSTCLSKHYGAVIVNNDEIIATGYNGAPRGIDSCLDLGYCLRRKVVPDVGHNARYDVCKAIHAEANAIISASRKDMINSTLYVYGEDMKTGKVVLGMPCDMCKLLIINAGIGEVIMSSDNERDPYVTLYPSAIRIKLEEFYNSLISKSE